MKRMHNTLLLLAASMVLAACNNPGPGDSNSSDEPSVSSPDKSTSETPDITSSVEAFSFSDDELGIVKGTFRGLSCDVTVNNNTLLIKDVFSGETETLSASSLMSVDDPDGNPVDAFGFGDDQYAVYPYDYNGHIYVVLSDMEWEESYLLSPTIKEFSGGFIYGGYGDPTIYDYVYTIDDVFDYSYGYYSMSSYAPYVGTVTKTYMADAFYMEAENGDLQKVVEIVDPSDGYAYYDFIVKEMEGGSYELYGVGVSEDVEFIPSAGVLCNTLFDGTGSVTYDADLDLHTATIDSVTYDYEAKFDEKAGFYFALTAEGQPTLNIQSTSKGLRYLDGTTLEQTKVLAYDDSYGLIGAFKSDGHKIAYDGETVTVDGTEVASSFALRNDVKALKFTMGGTDHYLSTYLYDGTGSLVVLNEAGDTLENNLNVLVNEAVFAPIYANEYVTVNHDGVKVDLVIGEDLAITYGTNHYEGRLVLDEEGAIVLAYDDGEAEVTINYLTDNPYDILLRTGEGFYDYDIFVTKDVYEGMVNQAFTSGGAANLDINDGTFTLNGQQYDYYFDFAFDGQYIFLSLEIPDVNAEWDLVYYDEDYFSTNPLSEDKNFAFETFIPVESFQDLVGIYSFEGVYGEEGFEMTEDGKFYVDFLNETNDGLDKHVLTEYHLLMSAKGPAIAYYYAAVDMTVYAYKTGFSLEVMGLQYVNKGIFDARGTYLDAGMAHALYINGQRVYVNGVESILSNIEETAEGTILTTADYVITIKEGQATIKDVVTEETFTLSKNATFDPLSLDGKTFTVDESTYELKVVTALSGAKALKLNDGFVDLDYVVTVRDGKLALKFSGIGADYYVIVDGENVTLEIESSLPPIPPPPPAPAL